MIEFIFASEAYLNDSGVAVSGVGDDDVALDRTVFCPTGQIRIPKTENTGKLNKRLEFVLG